jgi:hypothetical protein
MTRRMMEPDAIKTLAPPDITTEKSFFSSLLNFIEQD